MPATSLSADLTATSSPAVAAAMSAPSPPPERPTSTTDVPTAAIVGLVGVVIGALLTQFFALWREKRQWERQVAQDDIRWQREREERQEQWAREDEARWHQERLAAYSEILTHLEDWCALALKAKPFLVVGRQTITPEAGRRLKEVVEKIEQARVKVELFAPESIRGKARGLYVLTSFFIMHFDELRDRSPEEVQTEANEMYDKITKALQGLREAIRQDLKIDDGSVVASGVDRLQAIAAESFKQRVARK